MPPVRPSDFARLESEHGDDPVFRLFSQYFQDQEAWRQEHTTVHAELKGSMLENTAMTRESMALAKRGAEAAELVLDWVKTGETLGKLARWVKTGAAWIGTVAVAVSASYGVWAAFVKGVAPSIGVGP